MSGVKVCLVTGGSRGIGRAICLRMANEGYQVIVNYHTRSDAAQEVCDQITSSGGSARAVQADVTDAEAVRALFADIAGKEKTLDVLVNNAGQSYEGLFLLTPPEKTLHWIDANLRGVVLCSHAALRLMLRKKSGVVVNISSGSAYRGPVGLSSYAAAKAAMNSLTQTLAREMGSRGIRVVGIAPSWIETDMTAPLSATIEETLKGTPLKRMGTPDEVAASVALVCRDDMSYYTGQTLVLNGGA